MRFCTFSLSLAWFGSCLQRVTTRYRQFFLKNINIRFFVNLTVTRGSPLQVAPKQC